ncbi:MAG: UDP-N-acetylmuramoyl-tripeptide--D-alanyl-D-alanine ligase, partial [Flavobacteriaceae bacterium]
MEIAQLHQLFLTCNAACTDTRKIIQNDMFFALKGDNFNGNTYAEQAIAKGAKYAVVDDAQYQTSNSIIVVEHVLETLQKLAAFHRKHLNIPIVALTGSNGKTTTKELINTVLLQKYRTTATAGNLNNHIGVPLTLLSMTDKTEIGIVEMGANHLNEINFLCQIAQPDYGYITNFGKAHLEGFGSIEGVIKGKSELYDYLKFHNKTIFVNGNDAIQYEKTLGTNRVVFSEENQSTQKTNFNINFIEAQPNVTVRFNNTTVNSELIGAYNFNNISAAIAIGLYFEVETDKIKNAIEHYIPSNNRSQVIKKGSNTIILDAYNANPSSMKAALTNFNDLKTDNKIVFLGDMFELGKAAKTEHETIADFADSLKVENIVLIGENFHNTTYASH